MSDTMLAVLDGALSEAYAIERELEGGGMSRVFLAEERALGRRVVIKVLSDAGRGLDPRRFRHEILLSAGLQHPHIVPVHTAGEVDGAPYFVMPFVEGVSLRARLRERGAMPIGEATRLLRDVATALHYAHGRGIVHRDLKPENVMLSGGSAVVLDFGVAKAVADGAGGPARAENLTAAGFAVGTPRYMAPEQFAGDPGLDHRADLYAFGILAFELLTGDTPFNGTPSEVLRGHLVSVPPDLGAHAGIPESLAQLVASCLEKDPARRPANAGVVLDALDGLATPLGATRTMPTVPPPRASHGRWTEAIAIPVVYVLAAGGMLATLFRFAAEDRVREGIVAAAVIGSLLGLPIALASGLLLRAVAKERAS